MSWHTLAGLTLLAVLALALLPLARSRLSALTLLLWGLRLILAAGLLLCALASVASAVVPARVAAALDVLACQLQDDLPALRLARKAGLLWPGLGAFLVLAALPLLSTIERARRRAGLTLRAQATEFASAQSPARGATDQGPLLKDLMND